MADGSTSGPEQWAAFANAIFSDGEQISSPVYFSADFMREFVVALIIFLIGWAAAQRSNGRHKKVHLANELMVVQDRLLDAAYPKTWRAGSRRSAADLATLQMHLDFVSGMLKTDRVLNEKQELQIDRHLKAVRRFIEKWEQTDSRYADYHEAFKATMESLRGVLQLISTTRRPRWRQLRKDFERRIGQFATAGHMAPDDGDPVMVAAE